MKTSHQSDDDDHDEGRVLEALRRHLRSPERVALAVEAYRKEREGLARVHARDRRAIEREPAEVNRAVARVMEMIVKGRPVGNDLRVKRSDRMDASGRP